MEYPRVKSKGIAPGETRCTPGVYAHLDDLIRLQFKAQGFSFLPRQQLHSVLAGRHASRLRGRGLNFEEIRHYLPGDDIRNMDWKVTARTREPHVRVYTEERDRSVLLLVDQRITMFFGSRQAMKSVTAAETAALAAWRVLSVGDRVGAIVFDDTDMIVIKPQRSREQVMRIFQAVLTKNHALKLGKGIESNPGMINIVLKRAVRLAKHDYLVCSISDGTGVDEETVHLATPLTAHNDMIAALIYDPIEANLPDAGRQVMAANELQLVVDTSDKRLRRRYKKDFEARLKWIQEMSRLRTIPLLPIHTVEGVAEQIRRLLGHYPAGRRLP